MEEVFIATIDEIREKLGEDIGHCMEEAQAGDQNAIIYLDKNHTGIGLQASVDFVKKFEKKESGFAVKVLALIPMCSQPVPEYPFSYSMFIQCYLRCMSRNHYLVSKDDLGLMCRLGFSVMKACY
eukprot:CAMPEP_0170550288 /NCGR_PEP_ID=MMETSP0211-20121228/8359_1 /TAXON_ID=311385 /ORGANISM="Pseudokeronopsis sp., Strain OXSARD2" /LENGTH=124 /DNA_ID=CAMNT_0010856757 /DNA_START=188 /DNA_END=562 /DNA_ORIENTATION=-